MTRASIQKEIESVLIDMGVSPKAITPKASYSKDLGLDSLDFVEMVMEFEQRLNLKIKDVEAENLKTIDQTIDYILQMYNRNLSQIPTSIAS